MGTNYYAVETGWKKVRHPEKKHIGKSSGGWCFSLHVYPEEGLKTWSAWKKLLSKSSFEIYDEYGQLHSFEDFLDTVESRSWGNDFEKPIPSVFPQYKSWEEFFTRNYAEPGPNGLLRHKIDGTHCIGHGKGTYDYLIGEFS